MTGRLSTLAAALVVARRDFTAILFSRSFFFFLLGPLFPVVVGAMAGGIGQHVQESTERPELGIAMQASDVDAMLAAEAALAPRMGSAMPELTVVRRLAPGEAFDPPATLAARRGNIAAIVSGSQPRLFRTSSLAPASTSSVTASFDPRHAGPCSAVSPFLEMPAPRG